VPDEFRRAGVDGCSQPGTEQGRATVRFLPVRIRTLPDLRGAHLRLASRTAHLVANTRPTRVSSTARCRGSPTCATAGCGPALGNIPPRSSWRSGAPSGSAALQSLLDAQNAAVAAGVTRLGLTATIGADARRQLAFVLLQSNHVMEELGLHLHTIAVRRDLDGPQGRAVAGSRDPFLLQLALLRLAHPSSNILVVGMANRLVLLATVIGCDRPPPKCPDPDRQEPYTGPAVFRHRL
jgi:hypothetical protein